MLLGIRCNGETSQTPEDPISRPNEKHGRWLQKVPHSTFSTLHHLHIIKKENEVTRGEKKTQRDPKRKEDEIIRYEKNSHILYSKPTNKPCLKFLLGCQVGWIGGEKPL